MCLDIVREDLESVINKLQFVGQFISEESDMTSGWLCIIKVCSPLRRDFVISKMIGHLPDNFFDRCRIDSQLAAAKLVVMGREKMCSWVDNKTVMGSFGHAVLVNSPEGKHILAFAGASALFSKAFILALATKVGWMTEPDAHSLLAEEVAITVYSRLLKS